MATVNRRITPRFHLLTPAAFKRLGASSESERCAEVVDVSTTGVYFHTDLSLRVGETIEILLSIPWEISGIRSTTRRFVGRVTRVDTKESNEVKSGVGVQLLYWERDGGDGSESEECPPRPVLHNCIQHRAA